MKKAILCLMVLIAGVMVIGLGSAAIVGVNFVTPMTGENISGTNYLVEWTNTNNLPLLSLQYKEGDCLSVNTWQDLSIGMASSIVTYPWDTSGLVDGVYCLKIYDSALNEVLSGDITSDNTDPVADANGPYSCDEGDVLVLDASASTDAETGIELYEWDFDDDGLYDDDTGVTPTYTCGNGPDLKTVSVKVTDYAGNSDIASSTVNISNVAPVCSGITAFTDFAVTEPILMYENAADVIDSLVYTWDFDNGDSYLGNPANYTYDSDGIYNVSVVVSDGTDTCVDSLVITVVNPTILTSQEVMSLQNLDANFTPNEGAVANSFSTGLTGGIACTKRIPEPTGMTVVGNGNDCVVTWNAVENTYSGVNPMVVRVSNGTDYEYYRFDTNVWSWKIPLVTGWNLISIPVVPEDNSIENVIFDKIGDSMADGYEYVVWSYQYDTATGENTWLKSRKTGYGNLDVVMPGNAYWLNMSSSDILYGYGDKAVGISSPPEKRITVGWNLIGHYGLLSNIQVVDALATIKGYYVGVFDGNNISSVSELNPGKGYWVSINNPLNTEKIMYMPSNVSYNFI